MPILKLFSINVGIEEEKVTNFHIHILKKVIIKFINEYIHAMYGVCYLSYIQVNKYIVCTVVTK